MKISLFLKKANQLSTVRKLDKALYGILKVALQFWQKLTRSRVREGFGFIPYEKCVANKINDS